MHRSYQKILHLILEMWDIVLFVLLYMRPIQKDIDTYNPNSIVQWTLVIVNAWIVNNLSLVNIFGETRRLFYNINYMLNSKDLSLVNKIGDEIKFTITRVHCITFSTLEMTEVVSAEM